VKRLPILVKMFLLLVCFSFVLSAYNSGSTVNNTLMIPYVEFSPTLDGDMDEEWIFPPIGMFVYEQSSEAEVQHLDHSSFFKVAWNEDGFYFFAKVIDDTVCPEGSANSYENDCFEIYFDGGNEKAASYDANDVQWRYVYGMDTDSSGWCDAGEQSWVETTDGYTFELVIPVAELVKAEAPLFDLVEGTVIGFEVQNADNDTGPREGITKWWNISGNSWQDPGLFGTAILAGEGDIEDEVVGDFIEEFEFAPTVDGADDDWEGIPEVKMSAVENWAMADDGGFKDHNSFYRAAWDADAFYFFGSVIDDVIYTSGANSYEQDCFEIYFDGGNEKAASYDANDVQWRYVYGMTTDSSGWCDLGATGECAWVETEIGYDFELAIPVAELVKAEAPLFDLAEGTVIGWEVQCADNDTGTRDVISKWWNRDGNSWQDPSLFGTAELVGIGGSSAPKPGPDDGIDEEVAAISLAAPAIISGVADISYVLPNEAAVNLSLVNVIGQTVAELANGVQSAGVQSASINAASLSNGIYLVVLEVEGTVTSKKVSVIK